MQMPYDRILQNAYVVADVEAAAERWSRTFGVGPFVLLEGLDFPVTYRGQPGRLALSVALAQAGAIQIELIQSLGDEPSIFRDVYGPGEEGFHHVGMLCRDFDAELARQEALGHPLVMMLGEPDRRIAFVDARASTGGMIELYSDYTGIKDQYAMVAERAAKWDGREALVRP